MTKKPVLQIATLITLSLLILSGLWIGSFFLTALLYQIIGRTPFPFLVQVINSLLGLFLFILLVVSAIIWGNSRPAAKREQRGVFEPIIEALGRIAQGDFKVRLNSTIEVNPFTSELAKSVNQMAEELNQMEHMRQEFISNVSHEIQSPLTSIRGFAGALHHEHLSAEEKQHYLNIIEMESIRLSRITDNMLKLASLDAEQVKIEVQSYRLDKQIRALILVCEPLWTSKAIEIDVALEELDILADEDLLGQVWSNLLHNSIKFTPTGGKIHVEVKRSDNQIECQITDTGRGISTAEQVHVFERFYKADTARKRDHEGSGLGLTIVKKIVEMHQGTIRIASQPGAGTTMIVSLPASVAPHIAPESHPKFSEQRASFS